jgi:hypothetical protein
MDKIQKIKGTIQPNDLSILETTGSNNNIVGRDDKGNFTYKVSDYDISYNFKQETDFFIDRFGLDYTNVGGITNWSFLGAVVGSGSEVIHGTTGGSTATTTQTSSYSITVNTSTLTITPQTVFNITTASMAWTGSLLPQFAPGTQLSSSITSSQIWAIDIPYNLLVEDGTNQFNNFSNITAGAYSIPNWKQLYTTTTSSNSTRDRFFITSSTLLKNKTLPAFTQIVAGPRIRLFISASAAEITSSFISTQTTTFNYERRNEYWGITNYSPIHSNLPTDTLQRGIWTFIGTALGPRAGTTVPAVYLPTGSGITTYTAVGSRTAFNAKLNTVYECEALLYLSYVAPSSARGTQATASAQYPWGFFFGLANKDMIGGSGYSPLYTNSSSIVDQTQFPNFTFPLSENQFLLNTSSFGRDFNFTVGSSQIGRTVARGVGPNNMIGFLYGGLSNNVTASFDPSTPSQQVWGLKTFSKGYNLTNTANPTPGLMSSSLLPITASSVFPFTGGKTYSLKLKYTVGSFIPGQALSTIPFTVDWFVNGNLIYTLTTTPSDITVYATEELALAAIVSNRSGLVNNAIPNIFTNNANLAPAFYMTVLSGSSIYATNQSSTQNFRPKVTIDYIKTRIYPADKSDRSGDIISAWT